jgi:hypothetical protein
MARTEKLKEDWGDYTKSDGKLKVRNFVVIISRRTKLGKNLSTQELDVARHFIMISVVKNPRKH